MIPKKQFCFRAGLSSGLQRSLDDLLAHRWSGYRGALKRCRSKFSARSVHALRVESRRLLSALALLGAVVSDEAIVLLRGELKSELKGCSALRDTQVQMGAVAKLLGRTPGLEAFLDWLRRKEQRQIVRLADEFTRRNNGKVSQQQRQLRHILHQELQSRSSTKNIRNLLVGATGHAFTKVVACYLDIGPDNIAAIHRMRVVFKNFRYMAEALSGILPGIPARRVRAMQKYQSRMGEIQDVDVLRARAEKFAAKPNRSAAAMAVLRAKLLRRRTRLVARFLSSADELLEFWPSLSGPTPAAMPHRSRIYCR